MNLYFLLDGLTESFGNEPTTLDIASHQYLDRISSTGKIGLYEPSTRPYVPNPETYVVFPYFFGLDPNHNPGRAGLELMRAGIDLQKFSSVALFRIIEKNYDPMKGWDKAPRLIGEEHLSNVLDSLSQEFPHTKTTKSNISRKGNCWCVASQGKEGLEDYLNKLQFLVSKRDLNVYPVLLQDYSPANLSTIRPTTLYGWAVGSLVEAFNLVGVSISQNPDILENDLFQYDTKMKDFTDRVLPCIAGDSERDCSAIVYVKESSEASRKKTRDDKVKSLKFIDDLIGETFRNLEPSHANLIVLSDHQSNIGIERTYRGPTIYSYTRMGVGKSRINLTFSEDNAAILTPRVKTQQEVIAEIESFIKSTTNQPQP
ncbi:MAG TPA: hypothetical protein VJB08_01635 [Candidatus Nanoarchaeia archaeon]|nr:hypothetical protein [Candidatus Nanoarchaeia archaeon]